MGASIVDQRTNNRNYPLPYPTNKTRDDVLRLITAFNAIDRDIADIFLSLVSVNRLKANLDSPEFSGKPKVPTASLEAGEYEIVNVAYAKMIFDKIATSIADHKAELDPHTQYATPVEGRVAVDFGASGSLVQKVSISGQSGLTAETIITLTLSPTATADHSVDEIIIDGPILAVSGTTPGSGFDITVQSGDSFKKFGTYVVAWRYLV